MLGVPLKANAKMSPPRPEARAPADDWAGLRNGLRLSRDAIPSDGRVRASFPPRLIPARGVSQLLMATITGDESVDCVPVWTGNILDASGRLMADCLLAYHLLGSREFQLVGIGQRLAVAARRIAG